MEINTASQPPQEVVGGASQQTPTPVTSSRNMMVIVSIVVIVVAIIVGVYWFMVESRTSETARGYPVGQQPVQAQTLEEELNTITIESNDAEFSDVDKDLQSL